jgi:hypothetical protein
LDTRLDPASLFGFVALVAALRLVLRGSGPRRAENQGCGDVATRKAGSVQSAEAVFCVAEMRCGALGDGHFNILGRTAIT